jgi:DNA-binding MarR family transcriptional regulator
MRKEKYFVKVGMAFATAKDLTDGELRLLQIIMIRGFVSGRCYESKNTLADYLGTSKKTIKRRLTSLAEKDYITIRHHKNKSNGDSNDDYRLTEKSKELIKK